MNMDELIESLCNIREEGKSIKTVPVIGKHDKELAKIMNAADHYEPAGAYIAGGALTASFTGSDIKDVDMYFKSKQFFIDAIELAYDEGMWCLAATDRAVTFASHEKIIQLMHFDFFETAEDIFDAFDFTICMAAYDLDEKKFIFHEDFMKHAAQRYLKFHSGTRYPFGSLLRTIKYRERGFSMSKSDLLRITLCCHEVRLETWDDLATAIGGQYGEKVRLDETQPFSIDAALKLFDGMEVTTEVTAEEMPACADDLLVKLGMKEASEKQEDKVDWL